MEEKSRHEIPAELNAITDRLIELAAEHEKAKVHDASEKTEESRSDQDQHGS